MVNRRTDGGFAAAASFMAGELRAHSSLAAALCYSPGRTKHPGLRLARPSVATLLFLLFSRT